LLSLTFEVDLQKKHKKVFFAAFPWTLQFTIFVYNKLSHPNSQEKKTKFKTLSTKALASKT